MFFRRVVNFLERNLAGSKVFSHASASRDYIGLLDQTLDPRVTFWNVGKMVPTVSVIPFVIDHWFLKSINSGSF